MLSRRSGVFHHEPNHVRRCEKPSRRQVLLRCAVEAMFLITPLPCPLRKLLPRKPRAMGFDESTRTLLRRVSLLRAQGLTQLPVVA